MKASHTIFTTALIIPVFTLIGLSTVGAFTIMTALSVIAMLAVDFENTPKVKLAPVNTVTNPKVATKKVALEAHAMAA